VAENRQHPRKTFETDVTYQVGDGPRMAARCRDISLGGMFVETSTPLAYGTALRLWVRLPGMKDDSTIDAVVRWNMPAGMGVQFGTMGARDTHAITLLLASR